MRIADCGVNDDTGDARCFRLRRHDFTYQGAALVAFAINNDDVARLGNGQSGVDGQVVALTNLDCDGRSSDLHL